jgi:hypothetical protein
MRCVLANRCGEEVGKHILRTIKEILVAGVKDTFPREGGEEPPNILKPLVEYYVRLLGLIQSVNSLFSRRTLEAAFLVAQRISRVSESEYFQDVRFGVRDTEAQVIHPTWCALAERGVALIPRIACFNEKVDGICEFYRSFAGELRQKISKVSDAVRKAAIGDERDLNKLLSSKELFPEGVNLDQGDEPHLRWYLREHLAELGRRLEKLLDEHVENYLTITFENRGFLEYEAYNALVAIGIPALPRIVLSGRDLTEREVDVVALIADRLWLVEVTTRQELDEKILGYEKLGWAGKLRWTGIEKVVFVTSQPAPLSGYPSEYFTFISFEDLYSRLQEIVQQE